MQDAGVVNMRPSQILSDRSLEEIDGNVNGDVHEYKFCKRWLRRETSAGDREKQFEAEGGGRVRQSTLHRAD